MGNRKLARFRLERHILAARDGATPVRHDVVDDALGLAGDPIDDVVDADGARNVMDEKEQPHDRGERKQQRAGDGRHRRERMRQAARRRQGGHAVEKRAEEDAQRPLGDAVPTKLTRMRGENCIEARVNVIRRIAKTIETTVMIEPAIVLSITCAICGSAREGNSASGTQALTTGKFSSAADSIIPASPSPSEMSSGRTRNPPRSAYIQFRTRIGRRVFKASSLGFLGGAARAKSRRELIKSEREVSLCRPAPAAYASFTNGQKVNNRDFMRLSLKRFRI